MLHIRVTLKLRVNLFSFVARALDAAFQEKFFTLGGTSLNKFKNNTSIGFR
jgi:hypothetical protein